MRDGHLVRKVRQGMRAAVVLLDLRERERVDRSAGRKRRAITDALAAAGKRGRVKALWLR